MKRFERMMAALDAELTEVNRALGNARPGYVSPTLEEKRAMLLRISHAMRGRRYQPAAGNPILRTCMFEGVRITWRLDDQKRAQGEGWCIDVVNGGTVALLPLMTHHAGEREPFITVADAVTWILAKARAGSELHIRALIFYGMAIFHTWGDEFVALKQAEKEPGR